jgi:ABC-type multidrug transport system fused ATPase/permease subunit
MPTRDTRTSASPLMQAALVLLVIVTLAVVTFAIAVWLYGSPEGPGEFGNIFGLANALFSGFALIAVTYTIFHQRQAFSDEIKELQTQTRILHAQNIHQALATALLEYRSIEMFAAVKHLWTFHRAHRDGLENAYERIKKEDEDRIASLPEKERLAAEALTLHYRRQLVSRFYQFLAGLVNEEIVPEKLVYRYWNRGQLRIIPQVLEPIEKILDETYNWGQSNKGQMMRSLYDKSPAP